MISLNEHKILANINNRYAVISYIFDFENKNAANSNELRFEITIDPNAFISKFEANIDGTIFVGKTKEKQTAKKEYDTAKTKDENAILISQPHTDIPNVFEIKTNVDSNSKISLSIQIEQYLQKKFGSNELNIQILRDFSNYNIEQNFNCIPFHLNVHDESGIYDVVVPVTQNKEDDIIVDEQSVDKWNKKCEITGKIITKSEVKDPIDKEWTQSLSINDKIDVKDRGKWYIAQAIDIYMDKKQIKVHYIGYNSSHDEVIDIDSDRLAPINSKTMTTRSNELILKYKIQGEQNDSYILMDQDSNIFCHIISDVIADIDSKCILIPRRVVFVIDKSASMSGIKWENTISATIMALKQLRTGYDRFCVMLFDDNVELLLDKEMMLAENDTVSNAVEALEKQNVGQSTNIDKALLKAIDLIKSDIESLNEMHDFCINDIIFITDGEPNHGERNTKQIVKNVTDANDLKDIHKYYQKISIYSFGVGSDDNDSKWINDLNHSFLKLLSVNNNGFYKRIKKSSADTSLREYFSILSQPILSNIAVKYENKNIKGLTQTNFITLHTGNDLIICGKLENIKDIKKNGLEFNISAISGEKGKENNKLITNVMNISKDMKIDISSIRIEKNKNIERIWAYLKLQEMAKHDLVYEDMIEKDDDEKKEEESLPLSLALRYEFVTPWTSMIVVKEKDVENEGTQMVTSTSNVYDINVAEDSGDNNPFLNDGILLTASTMSGYQCCGDGGYQQLSCFDDDDIVPCERYSSDDVVCAAEELKVKQAQVKVHYLGSTTRKYSKWWICLVIAILLIIVAAVVLAVAFTTGFA